MVFHLNFLQRWAKRSEEQAQLESLSNKSFHSSFYHSQYEGYSERYILDKKGRKKIERIYTGRYYRPEQTKGQLRLSAFLRVILFVAGLALFLLGSVQQTLCNLTVYVAVLQALTVPLLFWFLMGLVNRLTLSGDLKIPDYNHSVRRLKRASLFLSICLFALAAAALIAACVAGDGFDTPSALCAGLFLASGLVFLGLNRMETCIRYQVIDNMDPEPEGSVQL